LLDSLLQEISLKLVSEFKEVSQIPHDVSRDKEHG